MLALWLDLPNKWMGLSQQKYGSVLKYGLAWLGGTLGGTLFDLKWLYHSIAKQWWHLDRRLWRFFTPHISGGLAFAMIALISSGLFRVFDATATKSCSVVVAVSFLVGYFSDSAIAKFTEIADILFGTVSGKGKGREQPKPLSSDGADISEQ